MHESTIALTRVTAVALDGAAGSRADSHRPSGNTVCRCSAASA